MIVIGRAGVKESQWSLSLCVCESLGPEKKRLTCDWTHKVLIYFYMFRDIVFLFSFFKGSFFFMHHFDEKSFYTWGTMLSSVCTHLFGLIFVQAENNRGKNLTFVFRNTKIKKHYG